MSASTRSSVLGRNVSPAIPGRAVVPERRRLRLHFFFLSAVVAFAAIIFGLCCP